MKKKLHFLSIKRGLFFCLSLSLSLTAMPYGGMPLAAEIDATLPLKRLWAPGVQILAEPLKRKKQSTKKRRALTRPTRYIWSKALRCVE